MIIKTMNKIILVFIGGIAGLLIGTITKPIIIKNISFLNMSGELGSLFSFIWIIILVLAGSVIGFKIGYDN